MEEVINVNAEEMDENMMSTKKLDEDIEKAEQEIKKIEKQCTKHLANCYLPSHIPSRSRTPVKNFRTQSSVQAPVFEASLYESTKKTSINTLGNNQRNTQNFLVGDPYDRLAKFQENKNACFLSHFNGKNESQQSINTKEKKNKKVIRQTDPLLTLEIVLTQDIVITLEVHKNDTPTFLAEKCFSIAGLQVERQIINKLAKEIEKDINEEIKRLVQSIKKEKRRFQRESFEKDRLKREISPDTNNQFDLRTDKRAEEREGRGRVLAKLSVLIGKSKTGDIVIREGDDPEQLVSNFLTTFSLDHELLPTFLKEINRLLANAKQKQGDQSNSTIIDAIDMQEFVPKTQEMQTPPAKKHAKSIQIGPNEEKKLLFSVQFNMEDGRKAVIDVNEGENLYQLAHKFALSHKLGTETIQKVWDLLKDIAMKHQQ